MKGIGLLNLISLNDKGRLVSTSLTDIARKRERVKYDEIICILLITIFILLFFAKTLVVFLVLLALQLIIGMFYLVKERRRT